VSAAVREPASVLFLCLFAGQAAVLVLSPTLVDIARDFDVSTSVAGQLRIVAAPVAALVPLAVLRLGRRVPLRSMLAGGLVLLAVGAVGSAVAPTFELLALAQVPTWIGVATVLTAGVAAAATWSEPARRTRVVAHALAGPPAAWIVGMPLIGVVAEVHWRLAFLVLPLPAAVLAGVLLATARRPAVVEEQPPAALGAALRDPALGRWALGELLAMSAWAGTLIFAGALVVESYEMSLRATGLLLAVTASAYLLGNIAAGRVAGGRGAGLLALANTGTGVSVGLTFAVRPGVAWTLALLSASGFAAGARTLAGTTRGLALAPQRKLEIGAIRGATTQLGYLAGSLVGGLALALGGYEALGLAYAVLLGAATLVPARAEPLRLRLRPAPAGV
jgi:DHA1 family inner membrane transport protein